LAIYKTVLIIFSLNLQTITITLDERTDDYRIGIVSKPILGVSNRIRYCRMGRYYILRASLQVQHELLTGRIKQQIKGHSRREVAQRARERHMIQDTPGYGRGLKGWEEETVT